MDELKAKYVGKYVGEEKIADIEVADFVTPSGPIVFQVSFESGKKKVIPEKGFGVTVSDAKRDATTIMGLLLSAISEECVKIVAEYDPPSYLFDRVGAKIQLELNNHIERASSILWFGNDSEYAPGFISSNNVTMLMADQINQKCPPKKDGE